MKVIKKTISHKDNKNNIGWWKINVSKVGDHELRLLIKNKKKPNVNLQVANISTSPTTYVFQRWPHTER